jgi:hypothetical protein
LNAKNQQGNTIFHLAATYSTSFYDKLRQFVTATYIDDTITNNEGQTSRDIERKTKEEEFIKQMNK